MKRGLEKLILAPLTAVFLYSSSCSIFTLPVPLGPMSDYPQKDTKEFGKTQQRLDYMRIHHDSSLEKMATKDGIESNFYTTSASRVIVNSEKFDTAIKKYDDEKFKKFVYDAFVDGTNYYAKTFPTPVKRYHVFLSDFGNTRAQNSTSTWVNTSIMLADVRRWHKFWSYDQSLMAKVIAAHEFTHVQNYSLDSNETGNGKEHAAIVVEALTYIHLSSIDNFKKTYRGRMIGTVPHPKKISNNLPNNGVRRSIVRNLFIGTLEGKYKVNGDKIKALEALATNALKEPLDDEEGFDKALKYSGFTYMDKPLNLEAVRTETVKEINEWYARRNIKLAELKLNVSKVQSLKKCYHIRGGELLSSPNTAIGYINNVND